MESVIIISRKLKYDNQTQIFKKNIDEGWNWCGDADNPSKGEGNISHKGTESRSGDRTYIGVVFDAPPPDFIVHIKTNEKKTTAVSPLSLRCWNLPTWGGSADFPLTPPLPPPSTVAPSLYTETTGRRRRWRTPYPRWLLIFPFGPSAETTPAVIASVGAAVAASRFSFGPLPCSSVLVPPPQ